MSGLNRPKLARYQPAANLFPSPGRAPVQEIVALIGAGVDETIILEALHGPLPPEPEDLQAGGSHALEEHEAPAVREVVLLGLPPAVGEVHLPGIVDVQELQRRDQRGLAHVVACHQVDRVLQLELRVVVPTGLEQHDPQGSSGDAHVPSSSTGAAGGSVSRQTSRQRSKKRQVGARKRNRSSPTRSVNP